MKNTTNNDKSVSVISDTTESDILSIYRTLHGKVLNGLQECDINPLFNKEWDKCTSEDHKNLLQQTRALMGAKRKDRTDKRVQGVRLAIQGVVDTYMDRARAAKAQIDALPADVRQFMPSFPSVVKVALSDIRACFPQGESDTQVFADLEYLGYKVTDMTTNGKVLVPFKAESDKVVEAAPVSGESAKAA